MATVKLTAQQKRDREFMQLLDSKLQEQHGQFNAEVEIRVAKAWSNAYEVGKRDGRTDTLHEFGKLNWWQRLWWNV